MRSLATAALFPLLIGVMAPTTRWCGTSRPVSLPIASVSVQKVIAEAEAGKAARQKLDTLRRAKTEEFNKKRTALDAARRQITDPTVSAAVRQQLVDRVLKEERELQEENQRAQLQVQELQGQLQTLLRDEIGGVVKEIAVERGIQYVINQDGALLVAPDTTDLTKEVLVRLNAAHPEPSKTEK